MNVVDVVFLGIDHPSIRLIVHVGITSSLENYYQESGRAVRVSLFFVFVFL